MRGIDRSVTYNYKVVGIDFDKLLGNENVKIQHLGKNTRKILDLNTGEYVDVVSISLVDDMFGNLSIGVGTQNIGHIEYCNLEISIRNWGGSNIKAMSKNEFKEAQGKVLKDMESRYGIELEKEESKYKLLELNNTIELELESKEYTHLLSMIELLLPKNYGNAEDLGKLKTDKEVEQFKKCNKNKGRYRYLGSDNTVETLYYYNSDIEGKIYFKNEQVKKVYGEEVDKTLLRIEYTLKNEKKVKSIFGDNYIEDITDEKITEFLNKQIEKDIIKPIEKHIKSANKELKKLADEVKEQGEKSWTIRFVNRAPVLTYNKTIPVLIDTEYQSKEYLKKELKKNYNRTIKRLESDFQAIRDNSYSPGTMELFKELKEKMFV